MNEAKKRSLMFGLCCCPVGIAMGVYWQSPATGNYMVFPFFASFAALMAPALSRYFLVEKKKNYTNKRGAITGCVGVAVAHYVTWYTGIAIINIQYWLFGMKAATLFPGETPVGMISGLLAALVYTAFSFVFCGWLTIPAGACIGWLYMRHFYAENDRKRQDA